MGRSKTLWYAFVIINSLQTSKNKPQQFVVQWAVCALADRPQPPPWILLHLHLMFRQCRLHVRARTALLQVTNPLTALPQVASPLRAGIRRGPWLQQHHMGGGSSPPIQGPLSSDSAAWKVMSSAPGMQHKVA